MSRYSKEEILQMIEEEDVEFVRLQYCDMTGTMKNLAILASHLESALDDGWCFEGTKVNEKGEYVTAKMRLRPDMDTFEIIPFRPQQGKVARLICDIEDYHKAEPFAQDPRHVLIAQLEKAREMGYRFIVGPECEFFLFNCDNEGLATTQTFDHGTNYDIGPRDQGENVRREIIFNLEDLGFDILSSYHEFSPGQHEIDFKQNTALMTADRLLTFKMTVKTVAKYHGYHATFMPKPLSASSGSGMHLNMALEDFDKKNLFFDERDSRNMSEIAYQFMAGIQAHIAAITAITNPLVNSYKRLISESDAPSLVTWSGDCYDSLLQYTHTGERAMRIELRSPDGTANPYLAFAVCLAAGLDGIEKKMQIQPESMEPEARLTEEEITAKGIRRLPATLDEALNALEKDELICRVLGSDICEPYIKLKRKESEEYRRQVTQWELDRYLQIF